MTAPTTLYYGTAASVAPLIERIGLPTDLASQRTPPVLCATTGLAWAYGAWTAGLAVAEGFTGLPNNTLAAADLVNRRGWAATPHWRPDVMQMLAMGFTTPLARAVNELAAPAAAVVAVNVVGLALDPGHVTLPRLPWEDSPRAAPGLVSARVGPARAPCIGCPSSSTATS